MDYPEINFGKKSAAGYTLLELMVVLGIVAILAFMAVPGVQDTLRRNAKDSSMLDLMSAVALARSEAVTQSRTISICRSLTHTTCETTAGEDWSAGWLVFTDAGPAGIIDADDILLQAGKATSDLSVITLHTFANMSFATDFLQFDEDGFVNNSTTGAYFKFCDPGNSSSNARAVWLSNTGRTVLSTNDADGIHNDLAGADLTCP